MKKFTKVSIALLVSMLSVGVFADTLTLKDGQTIQGKLVSQDANGVVFEVGGQQLTFDRANVAGVSFGDANTNTATKTVDNSSKESAEAKSVSVPAGTKILVRTMNSLNSKQHKVGHKFTAKLEADLVVDKEVVARRGTTLYGVIAEAKQSGRVAGKSSLVLNFTDMMINNQLKPMHTTGVKAVTEGTARRTLGTTARTAAIGGLINGSKGAKDGAKVGVGLSILTSGNSINIPQGTMLEFQLASPFTP